MRIVENQSRQITALKYLPKLSFTQSELTTAGAIWKFSGILCFQVVAKEIGRLKQTVVHAELMFLEN